jgi:hypothetical protein
MLTSAVRLNGHKNRVNVFETLGIVGLQDPAFLADVVFVENAETASLLLVRSFPAPGLKRTCVLNAWLSTAATINRELCISGRGFIGVQVFIGVQAIVKSLSGQILHCRTIRLSFISNAFLLFAVHIRRQFLAGVKHVVFGQIHYACQSVISTVCETPPYLESCLADLYR